MASRMAVSRACRIKTKLETTLQAAVLDIEDVSYQHAGHAGGGANETHFNVRVVSSKFEGQNQVKRHRMVYKLLTDELQSGLHALSITAKTPKEAGIGSTADTEMQLINYAYDLIGMLVEGIKKQFSESRSFPKAQCQDA